MFSRYVLSFYALLFLTFACNDKTSKNNAYAYVGGEIVNPKNDNVVIYNTEGEVEDSLKLDTNNRFVYKIENLTPGLYSFFHGGEYQLILLEPQDSVMFRLNTYDFDESLVFTGTGARKNNYLIDNYLANERHEKALMRHAKLEPEKFHNYIEEQRTKKLKSFHKFFNSKKESLLFKSIIESNINYNAYAAKEIYPFAYFGNNKLTHIKDLPEAFYAYRDSINYNDINLYRLYAYNRFLSSHIDNLAAQVHYSTVKDHSEFNRHTMDYNKSKLNLIDSIISNEAIKNRLLKYKTRDYISHNHTEAEAEEMLNYFTLKSTNEEDKANMRELVLSLKLLRQGNAIPDLAIINYNDTENRLNKIIERPTIIYFWSSNSKALYRNSHYKVKSLKRQFPEVDFVSINLNSHDDQSWKNIIKSYDFPKAKEFKFKYPSIARKVLAVNYLNKAIIVDENAMILHPNTNIYKSDFDEVLGNLLQKKHLIATK